MAEKRTDNGRDDTRSNGRSGVPDNGTPGILGGDVPTRGTDVVRRADVSPPGSRERSESDMTGYNPERDEDPIIRQGRFHRAAALRLAQPRTTSDMGMGMGMSTGMGMSGMGMGAGLNTRGAMGSQGGGTSRSGTMNMDDRDESRMRTYGMSTRGEGGSSGRSGGGMMQGPYGRDDRDDRSAIGMGGGQMRMGEQDTHHSLERGRDTGGENYRPWDRTGFGGEERQGQYNAQGQYTVPNQGQTGFASRSHLREGPHIMSGHGQEGLGNQDPGQWSRGPQRDDRYDPMLGMSQASPGRPGMGVNMGQSESFTARGSETGTSRTEPKGMLSGLRRRWQREPLTAREIMTRGVKTVRRDSPLRDVAQLMKDEDCGVVPIVDEKGCLVGIITDRDLVIRAFTGGKTPDQLRAGDVMTDDVECVHPEEDIHSIISLMGKRQIRRIPVVERDDRVIGIISMGDIANRADYDEELQEALDRISSKRSFWSRLT
jgi:CBS domain-containing protein